MMKKMLVLLVAVLLAGCAAVVKVEGEQLVRDRLRIQLPTAWNRLPMDREPFDMWTQDGAALDQLRLWAGIKPGEVLMKPLPGMAQQEQRMPTFAAGMPPDQVVSMFEAVYAADGSQVRVTRVEPGRFAGQDGVHFEFRLVRKSNDLIVRGVGWAATHQDTLYAAIFTAPELGFFKRLLPRAQEVVASARIRD